MEKTINGLTINEHKKAFCLYLAKKQNVRKSSVVVHEDSCTRICYMAAPSSFNDDFNKYKKENKEKKLYEVLCDYIDASSFKKDSDFYNKAGLTKKNWYDIKNNKVQPNKSTCQKIAITLGVDLKAAKKILSLAGHSFDKSDERDLLIQYCIEKKINDINDVNILLYELEFEAL